ncbi:MAG: hypothetical protein GXY05_15505 [Clostridiales bacterium]|nr:hypothetical protein [Clostridiales bacterium]
MLKKKKWLIGGLLLAALLLILVGFGLDNRLQATNYDIEDGRIPASFDGYRIAQLSDFHCLWFGEGQNELIAGVRAGEPDIIVLTGDMIDASIRDYDSVAALFDGLTEIAPVYAVAGNHEESIPGARMRDLYIEYGINYLKDTGTELLKDGGSIYLYGLRDRPYNDELAAAAAGMPVIGPQTYGILLYHRSDKFEYLNRQGYGLVLSGHLHGGLIRLPFIGGILSPEGGIIFGQKYTGGMYTVGGTTLISNRGLADSHNIPRIFNRPEIVFVTLRHAG